MAAWSSGDERRHLFDLARAARRPVRAHPHRSAERVPESTRRLLHVLATPGPVLGRHLDVLAWNPLAEALLGDPADRPPADRNTVSVLFREPEARMLCPGWENMARQYVAMLRAAVADDPDHPRAMALVGELSIHSAAFRRLWARHDVRENVHGTTLFQHPEVGGITLDWDTYPLPGDPGPVLLVFTTEPGTTDAGRLQLLASLWATRDTAPRRSAADEIRRQPA
ncbi:XRE family transcriptional regulator [Streptomyces sp. NPDC090025]|uniref:MmyB family transcriptional regulator n=1 Tax=Streptomyces sp. NPDC090025 TaxID=3365922 RepID=UPI003835C2B3